MKDRPSAALAQLEIVGVDGAPLRLEELVDKNALRDWVTSSERLLGVPIRIVTAAGTPLAGVITPGIVEDATRLDLGQGARSLPAPSGELYRVVPVEYDRRALGRLVLGPWLGEPPRLADVGAHIATVLEVMLFSGHKALLTSQMHLASVQESYRELCEKNDHLEEAYERLKELDRLKSNFLATVSHELRTPLTSIMGYGEMLAEGVAGALNEEQREFVETIRTKSEQLLGLIMSLLDLSKLESGTMAMRAGRVTVSAVLDEAVSTLAPLAMKRGVVLLADAPSDLPTVAGDADRLRQVFINLTENAVKFTPPAGQVRLSARLTVEQPRNEPGLILMAPVRPVVEIRVTDTGVGIAEEQRDKVFDPFYQIDGSSTREHGGAGLGLSIVKRLVEAHQGTIRVEGNTPHGAVFVVTLPAARGTLPPPAPKAPPIPDEPDEPGSLPPIFG